VTADKKLFWKKKKYEDTNIKILNIKINQKILAFLNLILIFLILIIFNK
jgi:hypothetical protein